MMLVKTHLKESTIPGAGLGCFASQFIPKNSLIWLFESSLDRRITEDAFQMFSTIDKEFVSKYAYKHNGTYYLCVDNGRFINHSETPNTFEHKEIQATLASRDIQEGEEILSDYTQFGLTEEDLKHNTDI